MERELWPPLYRLLRDVGKQHQNPHRRRSLDLLDRDWDKAPACFPWYAAFGKHQYRTRTSIERSFGHATVFAGGLGPLPARLRGIARVWTWVWAKLLINAVRIQRLKQKDL